VEAEMKKVYLKELSDLELKEVFFVNDLLREEVKDIFFDEMYDSKVKERVEVLQATGAVQSYRLRQNDNPHGIFFNTTKIKETLEALDDYRQFWSLSNKANELLEDALHYYSIYSSGLDVYDYDNEVINFRSLESVILGIIEEVVVRLVQDLLTLYNISNEKVYEYLRSEDFSDIYIKDNTYIAYEIEPTKEVQYKSITKNKIKENQ
jgi:hypothetical protein